MINNKGYAIALLEISQEKNEVKKFYDQFKILEDVLNENIELLNLLKSYEISFEEKNNIIDKIFKKDFDINIVNFIKILVKRNEIILLKKIVEYFLKIASDKLNICFGIVYSTSILSEESLEKIRNFYANKLNKNLTLTNLLDPSLVKGIRVEIENDIFENSISSNIRNLKQSILKKGQ